MLSHQEVGRRDASDELVEPVGCSDGRGENTFCRYPMGLVHLAVNVSLLRFECTPKPNLSTGVVGGSRDSMIDS